MRDEPSQDLVLSREALAESPGKAIADAVGQVPLPDDDVTVDPRYHLKVLTVAWLLALDSPDTQRAYFGDLVAWLGWCQATHLDPLAARRSDVDLWKSGISVVDRRTGATRSAAPSTVRRKLAAISSWYAYLESNDRTDRNPCHAVKRPKAKPQPGPALDLAHTSAMLDRAASRAATTNSEPSWRDAALLRLLAHTAVRVSAILNANATDYQHPTTGNPVLWYTKKGGDRASVSIPAAAVAPLNTYLALRAERLGVPVSELRGPLLVTAPHPYDPTQAGGNRLTQRDASNTLQTIARQAGLPAAVADRVTAHWTRRGAGTSLLADKVALADVQDLLQHASPVTTRDHYDLGDRASDPTVQRLATLIEAHHNPAAAQPADTIHQIKATQTQNPAGPWRRLHLPGQTSLGALHQTLLLTFGWPADIDHSFMRPDGALADSTRLDDLASTGTTVAYRVRIDGHTTRTVDLVLEHTHKPRSGTLYPRCSAGRGSGDDPRTRLDHTAINLLLPTVRP